MTIDPKDIPPMPHLHRSPKQMLPEETRLHMQAARQELRQSVESLFPPGFLQHRRAARREMLLAARSLIDAALRRTEPPATITKL
jgi:hypothetical protein